MNEAWKLIPLLQGAYEASSEGHIRRATPAVRNNTWPGRILKPDLSSAGYPRVRVRFNGRGAVKAVAVHTLVADAFIGPRPERLTVNHKNGTRTDNRPENLEYLTMSQQMLHKYHVLGCPPPRSQAKLSESQVREMDKLRKEGLAYGVIAKRFGVDKKTAWNAVQRRTYGFLK